MLLDTNAFIWFVAGEPRLKKALRSEIENSAIPIKLSVASLWELTIKHRKGKLPMPAPFSRDPEQAVRDWCNRAAIDLLPISLRHVSHAMGLAFQHDDPFDRVIAATAMTEGLELVTSDARFTACDGLRVRPV